MGHRLLSPQLTGIKLQQQQVLRTYCCFFVDAAF